MRHVGLLTRIRLPTWFVQPCGHLEGGKIQRLMYLSREHEVSPTGPHTAEGFSPLKQLICRWVNIYRHFGVACYLHLQGLSKPETAYCLDLEEGGTKLLRNFGNYLPIGMSLHFRRL